MMSIECHCVSLRPTNDILFWTNPTSTPQERIV
ncbi:hypothetical protein TFLX_06245 [Thermoflexales bacterium]|nr:hypothetical protein TFLX_06245 [Thermoflexales bacterium]